MRNTTTTTTETQTQNVDQNEIKVREIVRDEIAICLKNVIDNQKQMGDDLAEIRVALLGSGNKYKTEKGLAEMIRISYDYAQQNIDDKIMESARPALKQFNDWRNNGNWKAIEEIILNSVISKKTKQFFNLGSWAGIIAFISSLLFLFAWIDGFIK